MSSTALHWLTPAELGALYRTLAGRLRPGGILVDADNRAPSAVPDCRGGRDSEQCRERPVRQRLAQHHQGHQHPVHEDYW